MQSNFVSCGSIVYYSVDVECPQLLASKAQVNTFIHHGITPGAMTSNYSEQFFKLIKLMQI